MNRDFAFEERSDCICGARLDGDDDVTKTFSRGAVTFRHCRNCGSYVQAPRLTSSSLSAWYDSPDYQGNGTIRGVGYLDYANSERQRRSEAAMRYRRDLAPYLRPASTVLEIGASSGALLAELRDQGHAVLGCDLSQVFAETARQVYGLNISISDWLDVDVPDSSCDAIVLLGTISNLAALDASLLKARRKLNPDGFILFNFPAADSWPARLYGRRMWMFTPSVMQFMTRRGAREALARAGLRVESEATDRQSPTISKLLGHARLGFLHRLAESTGISKFALPFPLPLPGIVAMRARPERDAANG